MAMTVCLITVCLISEIQLSVIIVIDNDCQSVEKEVLESIEERIVL